LRTKKFPRNEVQNPDFALSIDVTSIAINLDTTAGKPAFEKLSFD
jgi:hypothetical protein